MLATPEMIVLLPRRRRVSAAYLVISTGQIGKMSTTCWGNHSEGVNEMVSSQSLRATCVWVACPGV